MKTRLFALFTGILILSPISLQASDSLNTNLKDIAILGSLFSWGMSYAQGQYPFHKAIELDSNHSLIGTSIGYEKDNRFTNLYFGAPFQHNLLKRSNWSLHGHWEAGLDTWQSNLPHAIEPSGYILRLIPVLEYRYLNATIQPYTELAIGLNYLSDSVIENKQKSSQFQFIEYAGFGLKTKQYKLGYRFMHISNGGINLPNPATDVHSLNVTYFMPHNK